MAHIEARKAGQMFERSVSALSKGIFPSCISIFVGGEITSWGFAPMVGYGTIYLGYRGIFVIWSYPRLL